MFFNVFLYSKRILSKVFQITEMYIHVQDLIFCTYHVNIVALKMEGVSIFTYQITGHNNHVCSHHLSTILLEVWIT